jgi:uncharacterized protein with NRDE domain
MCLVALAIDQHRRFPLVVAANRDEFFARPASRLAWWSQQPGLPEVLSGRDLESGGTWLGLTAAGRMALLTNVRDPARNDPNAPSRGSIVPTWLRGDQPMDKFWMRTALLGYNGFNLIAADFARGECFWASNTQKLPVRLERGVYGLSNAGLDTPWPKVTMLKSRLLAAVEGSDSVEGLADRLFAALADRALAADEELPSTGIPVELERYLSAAFIRTPDQRYGTRCSTLVITERVNKRLVTHVLERSFNPGPGLALLRRSTLKDWPPRYTEGLKAAAAEIEAVSESTVEDGGESTALAPPPVKAQRARGLLRPIKPRR